MRVGRRYQFEGYACRIPSFMFSPRTQVEGNTEVRGFVPERGKLRLKCFAILAAETLRPARLFSFFVIITPCLPHTSNHISMGAGL
jgi:hypothetical protein